MGPQAYRVLTALFHGGVSIVSSKILSARVQGLLGPLELSVVQIEAEAGAPASMSESLGVNNAIS